MDEKDLDRSVGRPAVNKDAAAAPTPGAHRRASNDVATSRRSRASGGNRVGAGTKLNRATRIIIDFDRRSPHSRPRQRSSWINRVGNE